MEPIWSLWTSIKVFLFGEALLPQFDGDLAENRKLIVAQWGGMGDNRGSFTDTMDPCGNGRGLLLYVDVSLYNMHVDD